MVIQWKTYASLVSTLPKSIYDETAGNSDALSLKWFFWISTQPFAIMFAPWRSQKSLPQTLGSDYWQLIHYGVEIKTWMFLYFLWSKEFFENNYYVKIGFVVFQIWLPPKNLWYSIFSAFRIMFTAYSPNALLHCLNIFHIFRCSIFIEG